MSLYLDYFGLAEPPFSIAPDPRYLYMSEKHREALAHLVYGISHGGCVLLTGEVGTGKTTICRCLLGQMPEATDVAYVFNPKLTVEELLATICDEFRIRYAKRNASIKMFIDRLNAYLLDAHANGRTSVLIIDEGQNLSVDVLEQMRLLTNLETSERKLLQIIMVGQPELRDLLDQPRLRQLSQRITARYHLRPLSDTEVTDYVTHRLAVAGAERTLFSDATLRQVYKLSDGIPRLINVICDRALLGAYIQGDKRITRATVQKAAEEVLGKKPARQRARSRAMLAAAAVAGLLVIGALAGAAGVYGLGWPGLLDRIRLASGEGAATASEKPQTEPTGAVAVTEATGQPSATINAADTQDTALKHADGKQAEPAPAPSVLDIASKDLADGSEAKAFASLFEQWNLTLAAGAGDACEQARSNGLDCLTDRGNLGSLRRMNRPAMMQFVSQHGGTFYATLTRLDDQTAIVVINGQPQRVPVADIEAKWIGAYTVLWRVPPGYSGPISPGDRGPLIPWLNERLARVEGISGTPVAKNVADTALLERVKRFQVEHGLNPDGLVWPHTLIHLNTATDPRVPLLTPREAG